jgi:thioesterase domain-containing protein
MTHDISSFTAATNRSYIEPVRTAGAGPPLFCFPGSGWEPNLFREMVAVLPEGQPVYSIDMEWLYDADHDFTIEQLAQFYLVAIRKIQRRGPYYFCGYSFGGLLAYEIAVRLIDEGDGANLVALLDAPNPALMSNLSEADSVQFHKTYLLDRLKKYALLLVRGDIKTITIGLAFIALRLRIFIIPAINVVYQIAKKPLPRAFRDSNYHRFSRAWKSYVPKRYAKSLVLFRVKDRGPEFDRHPSMGWDACVVGGVQVHTVPGKHVDMMSMPSVGVIAEKLATYLDNGLHQEESVDAL